MIVRRFCHHPLRLHELQPIRFRRGGRRSAVLAEVAAAESVIHSVNTYTPLTGAGGLDSTAAPVPWVYTITVVLPRPRAIPDAALVYTALDIGNLILTSARRQFIGHTHH